MSILTRTRKPATKPSRKSPVNPVPFGAGILEPRVLRHAGEYHPEVEPFAPTLDDRSWAETELRGVFDAPTVTEGPGFVQALQIASRRFRSTPGDLNQFLAAELDRVAALAVAIGATSPADFERKRDLAEMDARECWEARGYDAGYEAARGEHYGLPVAID